MGAGVCTEMCQEECPPGWACKPVDSGGPDLTYVCVSGFSNLCKPCASAADCKSPGGSEDACLDYADEGSFCGGTCADDSDCPWGFVCTEALTVQGVELKQCLAEAGVCPCSDKSVALGLSTPCEVSNEIGTCDGLRVCSEAGLTDCSAPSPVAETCNGVDDDCDGQTDEAQDVGGDSINLCNDDNSCTKDVCNGADGCAYAALNEGECMDGDVCTVGDHCQAGICVGSPVVCDDSNPCTDDKCDGLGGCSFENNSADCDDGNPCTVADECAEGICAGTGVPCDCQSDADCEPFEDGDKCNGSLFCNTDKWPYNCDIVADTVVICPDPVPGPDAICLEPLCDADSGACSLVPAHDGFACDDGDSCTVGETCLDGTCTGGVPPGCADDNPCTDDSCDSIQGCVHTFNTAPCNDGDVCTTGDACAAGGCTGGPSLDCDDDDVCTGTETCNSVTGCQPGQPLVCSDNDICTGQESCDPVQGCLGGVPLDCDDGNACNGQEVCLALAGCLPGQPLVCTDDNPCNGLEVCVPAKGCLPGDVPDCDDDNPCTVDTCDPALGCVLTPNQSVCEDGNLCTTGDFCSNGSCKSGSTLNCDDDNICTTDTCMPAQGCVHMLNNAPCTDNDLCT